ncbi:hypothetical protein LCGC14_3144010 [marine sediment metagenome]|uniref:Uncharacterized protein n=1 Tax=marine sediment metagenome TaxID=412755 RepID=A0A0F8WK04_9ZZZZ
MDYLIGHWWQLTLISLMAVCVVYLVLLTVTTNRLRREIEWSNVTNTPRDGFPQQMEACWEDVGKRGRFLTDLGGMSIKMREQMLELILEANNKPIPAEPAAGSYNDVLADLDRWLTMQEQEKDDHFMLVRKHEG